MPALPACGTAEEIPDPRQMLPLNVLVSSTGAPHRRKQHLVDFDVRLSENARSVPRAELNF